MLLLSLGAAVLGILALRLWIAVLVAMTAAADAIVALYDADESCLIT